MTSTGSLIYRVVHVKKFFETEELDGYDRGGGIGHTGTGEIVLNQ